MNNYSKVIGAIILTVQCFLPLQVAGAEAIVSTSVSNEQETLSNHINTLEGAVSSPVVGSEVSGREVSMLEPVTGGETNLLYTTLPPGMCEVVGGILSSFCAEHPSDLSCQF